MFAFVSVRSKPPSNQPHEIPAALRRSPTFLPVKLFWSDDVEQTSPRSLPRDLKCRSRMHYYLADLHAHRTDPAARAVLLDSDGTILEATTANILIYSASQGLLGRRLRSAQHVFANS